MSSAKSNLSEILIWQNLSEYRGAEMKSRNDRNKRGEEGDLRKREVYGAFPICISVSHRETSNLSKSKEVQDEGGLPSNFHLIEKWK